MNDRIEFRDVTKDARPRYEHAVLDVGGYEADIEESDCSDSDSSSVAGDCKHILISMAVLIPRRRRHNTLAPPLVGLMTSINPQLDDSKTVQFVTIIRSYCEKQADYLQLQRNFLAARCGVDDLSSDSTSTIVSNTTDFSVIEEHCANHGDGNYPKTYINPTTLKPKI